MTRRLGAAFSGALLTMVWTVWAPVPAHAHALLTASSPVDGASVDDPPPEVLLTFTEALDSGLSAVTVVDESGEEMDVGKVEAVAGHPAQLRVPLGDLAEGTYTVAWRTTSALDGHTSVGSVAFGVGVPAAAVGGDGQAVVRTPAPSAGSVAGRWLFYVGVVLMLGAAAVGVAVVSDPLAISRPVLAAAWVAAAAGVVATVWDQRATARTSLGGLLASSTGHKLAAQAVAVALAGVAVAWACRRPSRTTLVLVGAGASAAMLARALAGHANASSARWFAVGTQWVHLVSVGVWVGGLVWLLLAMRRRDPGRGGGLAQRFSAMAAATLVVVALSGTARALEEVGAWSRLFETTFGVTLLVKIGFFAALVAIGARNRFRHVPGASPERMGRLRRAVRAEVAIAAGVLGVTAVLTGLPPSSSVAEASKAGPPASVTVTGNDYATSVRVTLVVTPGTAGPNRFEAAVEDYDSDEPVPAERVSLRFTLDDRPDVAPATLDLTPETDSQWRGAGSALSIAGRWTVTALVQTPTDAVEVPMELVTSGTGQSENGGAADAPACAGGEPDLSYSVDVQAEPDPPKAEMTTFRLTVRRAGAPVAGSTVCIKVNMPDMQHRGVSTIAREASPGTYDGRLRFSMTGGWEGSVTISPPGQRPVSVPIAFEVK